MTPEALPNVAAPQASPERPPRLHSHPESANNGVSTLTLRVTILASLVRSGERARRELCEPGRPSRAPAGHHNRFAWEEPPECPRSSLLMKRHAAVSSGG